MSTAIALAPLPWQQAAWSRAGAMIDTDRLPHALMVAAAAGTGTRQFAQALGARLLCRHASAGTACGECRGCSLVMAGTHPDFLQAEAEEGSRAIKIDQVRELVEFAAKTPSLGSRKVILLGPAETMTLNAANALLKSLEEPAASTVLILFTHVPSAVPATVRSRCQHITLPMPGREEALGWLFRTVGDDAEALLDTCADRPMDALALFQTGSLAERRALIDALVALEAGDLSPLEFPALVSELTLESVVGLLEARLASTIRQRMLAGDRTVQGLFRLRDHLSRQRSAISRGANPNRQLIIEDCATRLQTALGDSQS